MKFNINYNVKVRLTDRGRQILREEWEKYCRPMFKPEDYIPPKEDTEGWSTWQLWDLMQRFGQHFYLQNTPAQMPFETTIEIIEGQ